eukprot:574959-Rhodomonas_salina.1
MPARCVRFRAKNANEMCEVECPGAHVAFALSAVVGVGALCALDAAGGAVGCKGANRTQLALSEPRCITKRPWTTPQTALLSGGLVPLAVRAHRAW